MRALTIRQPWAWAVAAGFKTVENRTRPLSYRGPLLIHAGSSWSVRGAYSPLIRDVWWSALLADLPGPYGPVLGPDRVAGYNVHRSTITGPAAAEIEFGAIIAVCELVDCHPAAGCCQPWGEDGYVEASGRRRSDVHHLVLEDVRRLNPSVPATGRQGLWIPGPDVVELLADEVST